MHSSVQLIETLSNLCVLIKPLRMFRWAYLTFSTLFFQSKLKSTSRYPQKMRPGKLCTDYDLGFVNKLHCCFLGHMIIQVKNIRMFIPIFHYKCCFSIVHFIAVSFPTEHCPLFHFPPPSIRWSVTGVTYQFFSIF